MREDERVYRAGDERIPREYRLVQKRARKEKLEKQDLKAAIRTELRTELSAESEQDRQKYRKAYRWAASDYELNELVSKFSAVRPWQAFHDEAVVVKPEGKTDLPFGSGSRESGLTQALYKGTEAGLSHDDYDDRTPKMQAAETNDESHAERQDAGQALLRPIANRHLDIGSDDSIQEQPGERLSAASGNGKSVQELAEQRRSATNYESDSQNRTIQDHAKDERASSVSRIGDQRSERSLSSEGNKSISHLIEKRLGRDCEDSLKEETRAEQRRSADEARETTNHETGKQNREHAENEKVSGVSRIWDERSERALSGEASNSGNPLMEERQEHDCEESLNQETPVEEILSTQESRNVSHSAKDCLAERLSGGSESRTQEEVGESAVRAGEKHKGERLFQADQELCFDPEVINMIAQQGESDAWQQIKNIDQLDRYAPENELARIDLRTAKVYERQQPGKEDLAFYTRSEAGAAVDERDDGPARLHCIVPMAMAREIAELGALEPEAVEFLQEQYGFLEKHVEHVSGAASAHEVAPVYRFSEAVDHARSMLVIRDEICAERHDRAVLQIERLAVIKQNLPLTAPQQHVAMEYTSDFESASYLLEGAAAVTWEEVALSKGVRTITDLRSRERGRAIYHQVDEAAKAKDVEKCHKVLRVDRDLVRRKEQEIERAIHDEPPPGYFVTVTFIPGTMSPNQSWPPDFTEPVIFVDFWEARSVGEFRAKAGGAKYDGATIAYAKMVEDRFHDWQTKLDRGHRQLDRALTGDYEREEDLDRF